MAEASATSPAVPFIVGVARSGTTLLRLMLDAHPLMAIPPESQLIPRTMTFCSTASDPAACFLRVVTTHHRWRDLHLDDAVVRARILALRPFRFGDAFRTVYGLYAQRFGKSRWGDKAAFYLEHMQLIQDVLPEARFLHLIRDGRDGALSVKDLWFGPNSLAEAADWWVNGICRARAQARALRHYRELRYEDLLNDPERVLREVCAFVDLPWDPTMLGYHRGAQARLAELGDMTEPDGTVVPRAVRLEMFRLLSEPPDRRRIGRWRTEMSPEELEAFEARAGDLLRELGYETGSSGP